MELEFIPYAEALVLKELGFDEPCFGLYENGKLGYSFSTSQGIITPISYRTNSKFVEHILTKEDCTAPTFSQAFRWFRKKYGLEGVIQQSEDYIWYKWKISQYNEDGKKYVADWYEYETYEEAELECLSKLIEIVKKQKEYESNIIV
jgi:thymidylate synthase